MEVLALVLVDLLSYPAALVVAMPDVGSVVFLPHPA